MIAMVLHTGHFHQTIFKIVNVKAKINKLTGENQNTKEKFNDS